MNDTLIRLTAAVIAGSDAATAKYLLRELDDETRAEMRIAVRSFSEAVDVSAWRRAMTPKVIAELHGEFFGGQDVIGGSAGQVEDSPFAELGLGPRSIESLGRLLEENAVPEGAG